MTEPSVFVEDVNKLKDSDEIKQAYVGLKDTNRYLVTTITALLLPSVLNSPSFKDYFISLCGI